MLFQSSSSLVLCFPPPPELCLMKLTCGFSPPWKTMLSILLPAMLAVQAVGGCCPCPCCATLIWATAEALFVKQYVLRVLLISPLPSKALPGKTTVQSSEATPKIWHAYGLQSSKPSLFKHPALGKTGRFSQPLKPEFLQEYHSKRLELIFFIFLLLFSL